MQKFVVVYCCILSLVVRGAPVDEPYTYPPPTDQNTFEQPAPAVQQPQTSYQYYSTMYPTNPNEFMQTMNDFYSKSTPVTCSWQQPITYIPQAYTHSFQQLICGDGPVHFLVSNEYGMFAYGKPMSNGQMPLLYAGPPLNSLPAYFHQYGSYQFQPNPLQSNEPTASGYNAPVYYGQEQQQNQGESVEGNQLEGYYKHQDNADNYHYNTEGYHEQGDHNTQPQDDTYYNEEYYYYDDAYDETGGRSEPELDEKELSTSSTPENPELKADDKNEVDLNGVAETVSSGVATVEENPSGEHVEDISDGVETVEENSSVDHVEAVSGVAVTGEEPPPIDDGEDDEHVELEATSKPSLKRPKKKKNKKKNQKAISDLVATESKNKADDELLDQLIKEKSLISNKSKQQKIPNEEEEDLEYSNLIREPLITYFNFKEGEVLSLKTAVDNWIVNVKAKSPAPNFRDNQFITQQLQIFIYFFNLKIQVFDNSYLEAISNQMTSTNDPDYLEKNLFVLLVESMLIVDYYYYSQVYDLATINNKAIDFVHSAYKLPNVKISPKLRALNAKTGVFVTDRSLIQIQHNVKQMLKKYEKLDSILEKYKEIMSIIKGLSERYSHPSKYNEYLQRCEATVNKLVEIKEWLDNHKPYMSLGK